MIDAALRKAVLNTLLYHSIFKYPLTVQEINKYLIGYSTDSTAIHNTINQIPDIIIHTHRYFIKGSNYDYKPQYTKNAWQQINRIAPTLKKIARLNSIQMIAISGSTAALSFKPESDIDLFIISEAGRKWTTRALTLSYTKLKGLHVNLKKKNAQNEGKLCANLFLDYNHLQIPHDKQDLYTAMEIAHLKVISNKNNTFEKFLKNNNWINKYLPNYYQLATQEWSLKDISDTKNAKPRQQGIIDESFEKLQKLWFKLHTKTHTTLENTWIIDHRQEVLSEYNSLKVN